MAQRRKQEINQLQSGRFPNLFKDPEKAESLFSAEGWRELLADLRARRKEFSEEVVQNVPFTAEQQALQNFARGRCAEDDDLIELEEEYKRWKEN